MNDANAKFGTSAKVIADSVSQWGDRLTTMEVTLHRFVLAELNTHRDFSRNSASSRAIPYRKQVKRLEENPAVPAEWRYNQRGMQGGDEMSPNEADAAELHWLKARDAAVKHADKLDAMGVHKSIVNRLLEPFMWHTVIISSTRWDNFFTQRASELAQPEIRVAAELMLDEYKNSVPRETPRTNWHLPYITDEDVDDVQDLLIDQDYEERMDWWYLVDDELKKISTARCARVSYLTHDGNRDIQKDIDLYGFLTSANPPHWSPLEHVATPQKDNVYGNFDGWLQLRHVVAAERGML